MKRKLLKTIKNLGFALILTTSQSAISQTGAALNLDGLNDRVNIGTTVSSSLVGGNRISVEAWVRTTNATNLGNLVSNYNTTIPSSLGFLLRRANTGVNGNFEFFVGNGPTFVSVNTPANTNTLNVWTHVAGTWDGSVLRFYINGVLSATASSAPVANFAAGGEVWIGGSNSNEFNTGDIDEVRIWNRTLCQSEIQNNMMGQLSVPQPSLLAYYQFNQGIAGGANATTTLVTALAGPTGTLVGPFNLTGATSNWVAPGGVSSTVTASPFVNISGPSAICIGNSAVLTATSSAAAMNYTWSTAATTASISISPTVATSYTVAGTNSLGCLGSRIVTIAVNANPTISINTNSTICSGNSATLNVSPLTPTNYCQGAYSTGTGFGDYITFVSVSTLTNSTGALASPFYTLYPASLVTTTLTAGTAYTISLQAGTFSQNDLAAWIDYNQNGVLEATEKLGEINNLGATPAIGTITFTVPLTALNGSNVRFRVREMDYGGTGIMDPCAAQSSFGETEDYNITIVGGVNPFSYSWTPSTFLSSTNTPTTVAVSATTSTNYSVTVTNLAGCSASMMQTLTVNALPTVTVTGNTAICGTGTNVLNASGASTYTWNTGATTSSISVSPTVTTNYTVVGTATTGCARTLTLTQNVGSNPTITVNSGAICSGNSFTITPSGASTYTYSGGSAVVSPTATSAYTVTGTNTVNTCVGSAVSNVTVNANPTVNAVSTETNFICVGSSATLTASGASSYVWNTTATTAVIAVSPTTTTSYTVTGTNAAGCSANAVLTQSVNTCTDIKSTISNLTSNFIVYPNPSNGLFNVQLESASLIEVSDVLGRVILTDNVNAGTYQLNLGNNVNGVYFVKSIVNGKTKTVKIVKE